MCTSSVFKTETGLFLTATWIASLSHCSLEQIPKNFQEGKTQYLSAIWLYHRDKPRMHPPVHCKLSRGNSSETTIRHSSQYKAIVPVYFLSSLSPFGIVNPMQVLRWWRFLQELDKRTGFEVSKEIRRTDVQ